MIKIRPVLNFKTWIWRKNTFFFGLNAGQRFSRNQIKVLASSEQQLESVSWQLSRNNKKRFFSRKSNIFATKTEVVVIQLSVGHLEYQSLRKKTPATTTTTTTTTTTLAFINYLQSLLHSSMILKERVKRIKGSL